MAEPIKEEAAKRGLTLREGVGSDPDTLMRNAVRELAGSSESEDPRCFALENKITYFEYMVQLFIPIFQ